MLDPLELIQHRAKSLKRPLRGRPALLLRRSWFARMLASD
jgi:hypothetical protein